MYVTKDELKTIVQECQESGQVDDRLAAVITEICTGLIARYGLPVDPEDAVQDCQIKIFHLLPRIDTTSKKSNPFSYLTTCVFNELRGMIRAAGRDDRLMARLMDAQRPDRHRGRTSRTLPDAD